MVAYTVRRILVSIPILLVVLALVFLMVRLAPGDPAVAALGDYASQEAVERMRERMGLNAPLWLQFVRFLGRLSRGDLGRSLINDVPVADQIRRVVPYTMELAAAGILFGLLVGVPLGVLTALRRNTLLDYAGRVLGLAGLSVPAFYLGILLMLLFAVQLDWFPVVGGGELSNLRDNLRHLVLPALSLGLIMTAYTTRMTRSAMLQVLNEDYIRTARAKGLRERVVMFRHGLRTALIPVVSVVGVYSIVLIGSSVMTEVVFSRPGLGKLMVGAMKQRDYTTLQSIMVIYASFVVIINLVTDLVYGVIDPRIRYQ
ncbi:MAG: ABC transporter permease [Anaerolineae bacterium]|jgi:ABC-type dipeptide/oligopeptide/nickel transport system permease component